MNHTEPKRRDWRVSVILMVIWGVAVLYIVSSGLAFPRSMLVVGTLFFVLLLPAMNDLISGLERRLSGTAGDGAGNHERD